MPSMELVWIVVSDFKAAVKFYTEVVGLRLMDMSEEWGWAELQGKEGARLGIAKQSDSCGIGVGENGVMTFSVPDLDQSKAAMHKKGVTCVGDVQEVPGHVRMQLMKDLDGNHFQIVQMLEGGKG